MEIKVGEQAMFKNQKQNWVKGEYVAPVEDSYVYRIDDDIHISKEYKKIEPKDNRNTYHIAYYTDKSEIYSNGVDIKAESMFEALNVFSEKYAKIEPIYIIKK
jgi:hypothetical protein